MLELYIYITYIERHSQIQATGRARAAIVSQSVSLYIREGIIIIIKIIITIITREEEEEEKTYHLAVRSAVLSRDAVHLGQNLVFGARHSANITGADQLSRHHHHHQHIDLSVQQFDSNWALSLSRSVPLFIPLWFLSRGTYL